MSHLHARKLCKLSGRLKARRNLRRLLEVEVRFANASKWAAVDRIGWVQA